MSNEQWAAAKQKAAQPCKTMLKRVSTIVFEMRFSFRPQNHRRTHRMWICCQMSISLCPYSSARKCQTIELCCVLLSHLLLCWARDPFCCHLPLLFLGVCVCLMQPELLFFRSIRNPIRLKESEMKTKSPLNWYQRASNKRSKWQNLWKWLYEMNCHQKKTEKPQEKTNK